MVRVLMAAATGLLLAAAGCTAYMAAESERMSSGEDAFSAGRSFGFTALGDSRAPAPASANASQLTSYAPEEAAAAAEAAGEAPAPAPEGAPKRLMVYSAQLSLLVPSVEDAVARFLRRVEEVGGYLEKREDGVVSCRVPAARFKAILEEVRDYGRVTRESVEALDVTKQYFDLRIRIENAERARERLVALLERAERVEDAIRIETELRRLAVEIDQLKGELKYLSERIAYSTITLAFQTNAPAPRAIPERKWSRFDWINQVGVEHVLERF
jgi:hypothetical protein